MTRIEVATLLELGVRVSRPLQFNPFPRHTPAPRLVALPRLKFTDVRALRDEGVVIPVVVLSIRGSNLLNGLGARPGVIFLT